MEYKLKPSSISDMRNIFWISMLLGICQGSVFSVYRTSSATGPDDPLLMEGLLINSTSYDSVNSIYTAQATGTYFFHLSAGTLPQEPVNMRLNFGQELFYNVIRESTVHSSDVISRDVIVQLPATRTVSTSLDDQTSVHNFGRNTQWTGWMLEDYMEDVLAFSAVRAAPFTGIGTIVFDNTIVDIGNVYDGVSGQFTAPRAGIYYFSFSTGLNIAGHHKSRFVSNIQGEICELLHANGENDGFDMISKAIMLDMQAQETVTVSLLEGEAVNEQDTLLSFSGFIYEPLSAAKHAWSVHSTTGHQGPFEAMEFSVVTLNAGELFNETENQVVTQQSGYYHISLSLGTEPGTLFNVQLLIGGSIEADVYRNVWYDDVVTLTRGLTICIEAGSMLRLSVQANTWVYSDINKQSSWTGFLLHETEC